MFKNPPPLSRVPGDPSRSRDSEKQGYIRDISKLSKTELLDLKLRQELLLNNRGRVAKLPDKGAKIRLFYEQIVKQLEAHSNVDRAAELFSELNIASVGKRSLTKLEWSGQLGGGREDDGVDSDDEEETDPLKILAQSTHTEKVVLVAKPEPSLITEQDLKDIEELKQEQQVECAPAELIEVDVAKSVGKLSSILEKRQQAVANELYDGHAIYICNKERSTAQKSKYLPFRTTKTDVHQPDKEKTRHEKHLKSWENTAATPPSLKHSPTKLLTLEEGVMLQAEKNKLLEDTRRLYAEDRLKQHEEIRRKVLETVQNDVMPGSSGFTTYRDASSGEEDGGDESDADGSSDEGFEVEVQED
ncbi:uncharacterized protein LOC6039157 [Culex quinquefasciatus]|uniref:uncharacterized protein LOC6039157 n=1 Tax=Culex quinquefasciatus TaxID=7176 RepID=UPI0018E30ED7|nr:uncharacterized protein LOC6039157 [Culex quinquefasciatus]